jgi:hypothetical protein
MNLLWEDPSQLSAEETGSLLRNAAQFETENKWPYTYELVLENKGRRLDLLRVTPQKMARGLIQILSMIKFMQDQQVAYLDWHVGNLVTLTGDDLTLIDYGEVYMEGDTQYAEALREHTMLIQVVGMMTDINNTFQIQSEQPPSRLTSAQKRITFALSFDDIRLKLLSIAAKIGYKDPIVRVLKEEADAYFAYSFLLDAMKIRHPGRFAEMMGFEESAQRKLHTWFEWDDVEVIYDNLTDIPTAIAHFTRKYIALTKVDS